jgi:hypothetical protein
MFRDELRLLNAGDDLEPTAAARGALRAARMISGYLRVIKGFNLPDGALRSRRTLRRSQIV